MLNNDNEGLPVYHHTVHQKIRKYTRKFSAGTSESATAMRQGEPGHCHQRISVQSLKGIRYTLQNHKIIKITTETGHGTDAEEVQ